MYPCYCVYFWSFTTICVWRTHTRLVLLIQWLLDARWFQWFRLYLFGSLFSILPVRYGPHRALSVRRPLQLPIQGIHQLKRTKNFRLQYNAIIYEVVANNKNKFWNLIIIGVTIDAPPNSPRRFWQSFLRCWYRSLISISPFYHFAGEKKDTSRHHLVFFPFLSIIC